MKLLKQAFLFFFLISILKYQSLEATLFDLKKLETSEYVICLDGIGHRIQLQVLNKSGQILMLKKADKTSFSLQKNIPLSKAETSDDLVEILNELLEDVILVNENKTLSLIYNRSILLGGFSCLSCPTIQEKIASLLEKKGFHSYQILLYTDSELALEFVQSKGAILVANTDAICFGTNQGYPLQSGGLGFDIKTGASAYDMGLSAIQAALEERLGYGKSTPLSSIIKKRFHITNLLEIPSLLSSESISKDQIASLHLDIIEQAKKGEPISEKILEKTSENLAILAIDVLKRLHASDTTPLYLLGDLFKADYPFSESIEDTSSFLAFKESYPTDIEIINISQKNMATEIAMRHLKRESASLIFLKQLPLECPSFEEFTKQLNLKYFSSEPTHFLTKKLSQIMAEDSLKGISTLLEVDRENFSLFSKEAETVLKAIETRLNESLKKKGRIFLVGAGTNGRIAFDLASKSAGYTNQLIGVIAGGDSALIRSNPSKNDDKNRGKQALKKYNLNASDTVILISCRGSRFNVEAGHFAAEAGAHVFYLHANPHPPKPTQSLFTRSKNPVVPVFIHTHPQAISGFNQLQVATLFEITLGACLAKCVIKTKKTDIEANAFQNISLAFNQTHDSIKKEIEAIHNLVLTESAILSSPRANFRRSSDVTNQGYITFLADSSCIFEALIDINGVFSAFSTNPIRRRSESYRKKEEFRVYMAEALDEERAWSQLLSREIYPEYTKETSQYVLSSKSTGTNSYQQRPVGPGNLVIGLFKLSKNKPLSASILEDLKLAKSKGALTGAIITSTSSLSLNQRQELQKICDHIVAIENLYEDPFGLCQTIALKTTLNLISTSTMVLANKVYGNQMIDIETSSPKRLYRCLRSCRDIWNQLFPHRPVDDKTLYHYIQHVEEYRNSKQKIGIYTPSLMNIVLSMMYYEKTPADCDRLVEEILARKEKLEFLNLQ